METTKAVERCKELFATGITLNLKFRLRALQSLKKGILARTEEISEALYSDLQKGSTESYMTEIGMVISSIRYYEKNLTKLTKTKRTRTPLAQFPAKSFIIPSPYGTVLVISPWNYPFLLALDPIIAAIAAGNTIVLKPSEISLFTSKVVDELINEYLPKSLVEVVQGDARTSNALLQHKFDYIFFTGGKTVGKIIMQKAAEHITPFTLELGGKCPVIVDKTADLPMAAKRIVFGKFLNCGQTCIAPDYLLCHSDVKQQLIGLIKLEIERQYGKSPMQNAEYGKIINDNHYERLIKLLSNGRVVIGGRSDKKSLRIEPTVVENADLSSPLMTEEIFGPILPIIEWIDFSEVRSLIAKNPTPLALYLFTKDQVVSNDLIKRISFGGGCLNDTIVHIATNNMPFGGVGTSGIGAYHGKWGFNTFSHFKSIVIKTGSIDFPWRYMPYDRKKESMIKRFMK